MANARPAFSTAFICAFAGLVMAYGWGYRGITGHEGGAAIPGALLGLAVCLAAPRADWHRRAAVAGLCGAIGWAWGGSLSYMEQTMYSVTDSFADVYYGYAMLFLFGALWAGIGGAILGLAFTLPRSAIQRLAGPFTLIAAAYFLTYLYGLVFPQQMDRFHDFTAVNFHDGDWFPALTALVLAPIYALVRPRERKEALLVAACAAAWWVGYLGFTKLGGISLGPPYRSESWGGVVGILAVLIFWLIREKNRAALMLCMYGVVGGGLAFSGAVFVRHPVRVSWGPFESWGGLMQWKIAEESFGLFMGLAVALAVVRLYKGGLAPADEDAPRKPLDVYAGFVMLVALMWMNLRRAPERWIDRYEVVPNEPIVGIMPWTWFTAGGLVLSAVVCYGLYQYKRDRFFLAPASPYAKGGWLLLFVMWVTAVEAVLQHLPGARTESFPLVDATFIAMAAVVTCMLFSRHSWAVEPESPTNATAPASDLRWRLGMGHGAVWAATPIFLAAVTALSMAMQDGPVDGARLRFGPDAYWREASSILGKWEVQGMAPAVGSAEVTPNETDFTAIDFLRTRAVVRTLTGGEQESALHRWRHADSVVWFDWLSLEEGNPEAKALPMRINDGLLYIPWPPADGAQGFVVLERIGD